MVAWVGQQELVLFLPQGPASTAACLQPLARVLVLVEAERFRGLKNLEQPSRITTYVVQRHSLLSPCLPLLLSQSPKTITPQPGHLRPGGVAMTTGDAAASC